MPTLPATHLSQIKDRRPPGLAPDHLDQKARRAEKERGNASSRGYDARWNKARKMYLDDHPLCADPNVRHGGRPVAATVVDHIVPHDGDYERFWDESNWRALCKPCHDRKTARERQAKRGGRGA